jgi:hypothetical protein
LDGRKKDRIAITRYRWAALVRLARCTGADKFLALLMPNSIGSSEDPPCADIEDPPCADIVIIAAAVDDRSVAIGGDCDSTTLDLEWSNGSAPH